MRGLLILIMGFSWAANAAIQKVSSSVVERVLAPDQKNHRYIEHGIISGGEIGTAYTLLDLRRINAPKDRIERLVLDLGDDKGRPLMGKVSYFQVSVEKNKPRVVIDLSQMQGSGVNQQKLKQAFMGSRLVADAKINYDPVDASITVQLTLKKPLAVEAFRLAEKDKVGRLVVDLKEK